MDWIDSEQLMLIIKESKHAAFWMVVGAVLGTIISFMVMIFGLIKMKSKNWPPSEKWGNIIRAALLVLWFFTLPSAFALAGGIWGTGFGLKKTIQADKLIERASDKTLGPLVSGLWLSLKSDEFSSETDIEKKRDLTIQFYNQERAIDLKQFQEHINTLGNEGLKQYAGTLAPGGSAEETGLAVIGTALYTRVMLWIAKSKVEELNRKVDDVVSELRGENSSSTSAGKIAASIGRIHLEPLVLKKLDEFIKLSVIVAAAPAAIFILIPVGFVWVIFRFKKASPRS